MQPPPNAPYPSPYPYQPPPRKGFPVWGWILLGCGGASVFVILILAAILFPVFAKARERARQVSCLSNEKQMSLALLQYVQDNDDSLPASSAWIDRTKPYLETDQPYHCPTVSLQDADKYGYAFDSRLSAKNLSDFASPKSTMTIYDSTNLSRNATDPGTSLPSPGRHSDGNNIAYLDGHARWNGPGASQSAGE